MDSNAINQLQLFLEDIGFPIDKNGLLMESLDSPLSHQIKDAIALLPDREYLSREDVKQELIGIPEEDDHKKVLADDEEEVLSEMDTGGIEVMEEESEHEEEKSE